MGSATRAVVDGQREGARLVRDPRRVPAYERGVALPIGGEQLGVIVVALAGDRAGEPVREERA